MAKKVSKKTTKKKTVKKTVKKKSKAVAVKKNKKKKTVEVKPTEYVNRINTQAMNDCLHTIHPERAEQDKSVETTKDTLVYTISGKQDFKDENKYPILVDSFNEDGDITELAENKTLAFAKTAVVRGRQRYYIKRNGQGSLYNPMNTIDDHRGLNKIKGIVPWKFTEVRVEVFQFYIDFLRTKNKSRLTYAQRAAM